MNPTIILGFIGIALYLVAVLIVNLLKVHPSPEECKSKACAKTGMNYGLELIGIGIVAFTLTAPAFLFLPNTTSEESMGFILFFAFMSTALVLYGIWAWKSYREVYKELLL